MEAKEMILKEGDYVRYTPEGRATHSWLKENEIVQVESITSDGLTVRYRSDHGSQSGISISEVTVVYDETEQFEFEMRLAEYRLALAQESGRAARQRVMEAKKALKELKDRKRGLPVSVSVEPEVYKALCGLADELGTTSINKAIDALFANYYK